MRLTPRRRWSPSNWWPHSHLSPWQRLLCVVVALAPAVWLAVRGANALIRQIDGVLAQSAPLVSAEASRSLGREVRIGSIESDLLAGGVVGVARRLFSFGTVPIILHDVALANGGTLAGSGILASAPLATIELNVPALLRGEIATGALPRVEVTSPFLLLIREADGSFNVAKILPPKKPNEKPGAPFETYVAVQNGKVTFRDFLAFRATQSALAPQAAAPAENYLQGVTGYADLTGSRQVRFAVDTAAQPGTPTARRLAGRVSASGSLGRGEPEVREGAPSAESARYLVHVRALGAAAAYWMPYFVSVPQLRIEDGIANADVALSAPRPADPGAKAMPRLALSITADFTRGRLSSPLFARPLTDAAGTVHYDSSGAVDFDVAGRVIGRPVSGKGTVWDLPGMGGATTGKAGTASGGTPQAPPPQLAVQVTAPSMPVAEAVRALLPKVSLPKELQLAGVGSVTASINGSAASPIVTASGTLSEGRIVYGKYPALTGVSGNVAYSQGLLGVTNLRANVEGGGTVRGRLGYRVAASGREGAGAQGNAVFQARVEGVALPRLAAAAGQFGGAAGRPLRLEGLGDADIIGKRVGGVVSGAANVTARGLSIGGLPFPAAAARLVLNDGALSLPAARILSPAGALTVDGDLAPTGGLSLRYAASSVDIGRIARALGYAQYDGLVSSSGTVGGTTAAPRIQVDTATALGLRYRTPAQPAHAGLAAVPAREYAIDTATIRNAVVTKDEIVFEEPLLLRRYPAVAAVSGRLTGIGSGAAGARLALMARVQNLDIQEAMRQLGVTPGGPSSSQAVQKVVNALRRGSERRAAAAAATTESGEAPPFSGFVTDGTVRVTGPLSAPQVSGAAVVGRLLVGPYPVDGGYVRFAYGPEGLSLPELRVRASAGIVTGSAAVGKEGQLSGHFDGTALNLAPLSFLTRGAFGLAGTVSVAADLSGNTKDAVVAARIAPSSVQIAGIPFTDLHTGVVRFHYAQGTNASSIAVPEFGFTEEGTTVDARDLRYDFATGRFGADLRVDSADLGKLLDSLRRSDLASTPAGAGMVRTLDSLPYPVAGHVVLDRLTVAGRYAGGTLTEKNVRLSMNATGLRVGPYVADNVTAAGSLAGDLVRLDRLSVVSQNTTILGSGTADLSENGRINVVLDSNQASLDIVRAVPGESAFPIRGQVDVTLAASGLTRNPTVTASLEGRDLTVGAPPPTPTPAQNGEPTHAVQANVPPPSSAAATKPVTPFVLSLVRIGAYLQPSAEGGAHLVVSDAVLRSGDNEIRGSADVPLDFGAEGSPVATDRPITLKADVTHFDLASLAPTLSSLGGMTGLEMKGELGGSVAVGGTLQEPSLSGDLTLSGGQLRLPPDPGNKRDRINPITALEGELHLRGDRIEIDSDHPLRVALGAPTGQKGDFGSATLNGAVTFSNLSALQRLFGAGGRPGRRPGGGAGQRPGGGGGAPLDLGGTADLTLVFDHFRPMLDNATALFGSARPTGLGESVRAIVDGTVHIDGALLRPNVYTAAAEPLRLAGTYIQLPTRAAAPGPATAAPEFNPQFSRPGEAAQPGEATGPGIVLDMSKGVTIVQNPSFRLDSTGRAEIDASLSAPEIKGSFTTTGGYYNYAFQRFVVQKDGQINVSYRPVDGLRVNVQPLIATASVYAPNAARPTLTARASDPTAILGSPLPPVSSNSNRYRITIEIRNNLLLGDTSDVMSGQPGPELTLSSDPYLTRDEIIALIGTSDQIALAARGDVSSAIQLGAQQALYSGLVPRALAPLENSVASAFGLDAFGIEYSPDAPFILSFTKRLPNPFDRFVLQYSRSFVTRDYAQTYQPYTYRISYDVYQLRQTRGVRPRLQAGVQSDDQNIVTYFLQGTVNY